MEISYSFLLLLFFLSIIFNIILMWKCNQNQNSEVEYLRAQINALTEPYTF